MQISELPEHRTVAGSGVYTLGAVALSASTGALIGSVAGLLYKQNPVSWGFAMGSNWAVAAVPFFACREGVMHFRHWRNQANNRPNLLLRDSDEFIASVTAGSLVGGALGHVWRGPKAIPAGVVVYGLAAAVVQTIWTTGRLWRQSVALRIRLEEQDPSPKPSDDASGLLGLGQTLKHLKTDYRRVPHNPADDDVSSMDPIGWAVKKISSVVKDSNPDVPQWASPLLNAIDIEYRMRLNAKIAVLEQQVSQLRQEIEKRNFP